MPEPSGFESAFITGGVLIVVVFAILFFFFLRSMSRQQELNKTRPLPEVPRLTIEAGWYPTPDDTQERYHDGEQWTEQFRPLGEGKLADEE